MKSHQILLVAVALILLSCEKQILFNGEGTETRLVLNSVAAADDVASVNLSLSRHILSDDQFEYALDAEIRLYENNVLVEELENIGEGNYIGVHIIQIDHDYKLTAKQGQYEMISALTTVPDTSVVTLVSVHSDIDTPDGEMSRVILNIADPVGANFYHLYLLKADGFGKIAFTSSDPYLESGDEELWYYDGALFSDAAFDGTTVELHLDFFPENNFGARLFLVCASEDYYLYNRTLTAFETSQFDLFAQPVQVYSNVTGGHGVFSGYSVVEVPFEL